jgi:hypothetical protein
LLRTALAADCLWGFFHRSASDKSIAFAEVSHGATTAIFCQAFLTTVAFETMSVKRIGLVLSSAAALLCAASASAQLRPLSEQELSTTRGQGLLVLTNSNYGGFDFTRIALGADVTLNASFRNIRLGEYNTAPRNGTGADIDMPLLQFGRSDAGGGKRWDGSCTGTCLSLSQVGAVRAGDASGASRDFWISTLKTAVQFQPPSGTVQMPDAAQAGFWMNWRDRLSAINTTGTAPPNLPLVR